MSRVAGGGGAGSDEIQRCPLGQPLNYGVDGLRGVLNGGFEFGVVTDFAVLGGLAAILLAISAWLFSNIEA